MCHKKKIAKHICHEVGKNLQPLLNINVCIESYRRVLLTWVAALKCGQ